MAEGIGKRIFAVLFFFEKKIQFVKFVFNFKFRCSLNLLVNICDLNEGIFFQIFFQLKYFEITNKICLNFPR